MDPITLSAILAGGSSIMGMIEGNKAQAAQERIAQQNFQLEKDAAARRNAIAQQTMEMQRAGTTDAEGNQTQYIPGRGWVSTASPVVQAIIARNRAEQAQRQGITAQDLNNDFARRGREGSMADATMNEWQHTEVPDVNTIRQALIAQKTAGIDRGFDDESRMASRQNLRSGASNTGEILAALAARRADAHADARNSSYGEALNLNNSLKSANDSRFGNKYNMLATRATGSQPGFMPDGTNDSLRSALQARQNTNAQAMGVAGSLVGDAPKLDNSFAKPNYSNAIALGGLADLISTYKTFDSGGDGFQSGSRNSQLMKQAGTSIRDRSRAAVPTF